MIQPLTLYIYLKGGGPQHDRLGFRYWKNPGAANTYLEEGNAGRFVALLSTMVLSAVSMLPAKPYIYLSDPHV